MKYFSTREEKFRLNFRIPCNWNTNQNPATVVPVILHTPVMTWPKFYTLFIRSDPCINTLFQPKWLQNHTLWDCTYLYRAHQGVSPYLFPGMRVRSLWENFKLRSCCIGQVIARSKQKDQSVRFSCKYWLFKIMHVPKLSYTSIWSLSLREMM